MQIVMLGTSVLGRCWLARSPVAVLLGLWVWLRPEQHRLESEAWPSCPDSWGRPLPQHSAAQADLLFLHAGAGLK